jgi:hypothetical protein
MLPIQDDPGFHEGGQYVHLSEIHPMTFEPGTENDWQNRTQIIPIDLGGVPPECIS